MVETSLPPRRLETVLASVSIFEPLRPDEIGRVARNFEISTLVPGATLTFEAGVEAALLIVIEGRAEIEVRGGAGVLRSTLEAGDRFGEMALLTGVTRTCELESSEGAVIASIKRPGLDALLLEFPAMALPLARELASELHAKNDIVRQLLELHAEALPAAQLKAAVDERRRTLARHGARVARISPGALFRRLIVQEGAEPPFWILIGFIASLGIARLVVAMIFKYHLEKQLFALVPGNDPNPMHVHHFNYGMLLIGASGLAALFPFGRRALRLLAFAFGFGVGLVFDEFALIWNLNPEYAQDLSLIAAGIMAAILVQLTYFRRFWAALLRRGWFAIRGAR
ncbi:MAG: cyclic nucleotide-binding domain-containing protein [Polyangiaceae bacterium]